jgi:hypothetical protein
MAGKLSPTAARRVSELEELIVKMQRVYAMTEQYAATKTNPEILAQPLKREFSRLRAAFMRAGLDAMSQLAAGMETAAGRGGNQSTKSRILREGVASLKFQLELEHRSILAGEAKIAQEKADVVEAAKKKAAEV